MCPEGPLQPHRPRATPACTDRNQCSGRHQSEIDDRPVRRSSLGSEVANRPLRRSLRLIQGTVLKRHDARREQDRQGLESRMPCSWAQRDRAAARRRWPLGSCRAKTSQLARDDCHRTAPGRRRIVPRVQSRSFHLAAWLLPGISRSGVTIGSGLTARLDHAEPGQARGSRDDAIDAERAQ